MRYTAYDLAGCLHYNASIAQLAMQANWASLSCSCLLKINISFSGWGSPSFFIYGLSCLCWLCFFSPYFGFFLFLLRFCLLCDSPFLYCLRLFPLCSRPLLFSVVVLFFSILGSFFLSILALSSLASCFSFLKLRYSFVYVRMKVVKETICQKKSR